jgi:hypothetical protein
LTSNKALIKFYKGVCIEQIHLYIVGVGVVFAKSRLDKIAKNYAQFPYDSCVHVDVTIDNMQELIHWTFQLGDDIGVFIDYPDEEQTDPKNKLDLNFNR